MHVAVDTLEDEVEPYLLRCHFIIRSPRGRRATAKAYQHLGLREPEGVFEIDQPRLFD
jgi:Holliday junction DNA helicase RuvB